MTPPRPEPRERRVATATLALVLVGLLVGGAVVVVLLVAGRVRSAVGSFTHPAGSTTITQSVVVERMREVARLVTSETTLRDVVLYRNSRLGSTKRSLVVVTGRILTGFDLDRGTEVRVDQAGRRIHLSLPRAAVLGVDHAELGQEVKAVVVPRVGARLDTAALAAWVAAGLAYFKVPAHWELRASPLPRNATGKVLKHVLAGDGADFVED